MTNTYESDSSSWATSQAALLRARRLDQADIEHIAEEIENARPSCCLGDAMR